MTTELQGLNRCDRCERLTDTVRVVRWTVETVEQERVSVAWKLCRRCRSQAHDTLRDMIRGVPSW